MRKVTPRTRCRHIVEETMTCDLLFRISADMFWSRFNCEIAIWRRLQGSLFLYLSPGAFYCTHEHWCEKGKLTPIVLSGLFCAAVRSDFNALVHIEVHYKTGDNDRVWNFGWLCELWTVRHGASSSCHITTYGPLYGARSLGWVKNSFGFQPSGWISRIWFTCVKRPNHKNFSMLREALFWKVARVYGYYPNSYWLFQQWAYASDMQCWGLQKGRVKIGKVNIR